jgi:protein-disulfide isomerase
MLDYANQPKLSLPVSADRDHIRGPHSAAISLVEYGDFECPHCGQAHFVLNELMRHVGKYTQLVFRHFPLANIHPHARRAAEAAEAAGAQGRFWEMHDILFENQDALEDEDLLAYSRGLGLDVNRFAQELAEERYAPRVHEEFLSGVRSGVNGTPTFFINGYRHNGAWDLESLREAIDEHLKLAEVSRTAPVRGGRRPAAPK